MKAAMLRAATLIDAQTQSNYHIVESINHAYPLHGHDFYEIFIILTGRCAHLINGETQMLEEREMVFIRPGDTHGYDFCGDTDCRFLNVNFYPEAVEYAFEFAGSPGFASRMKRAKLPPVLRLAPPDMDALMRKGSQIGLYESIDKAKARSTARSWLVDALTLFFVAHRDEDQKAMPSWLDHLLLELQKKENFTCGPGRLVELSGRSAGHLNRVFKEVLQMTPTAYLNRLRLTHARNLLLTTNLGIIEVAYESGFDNLSHFYHLFKKQYGVSPGKTRSV
ncbi:AraC family transcriptional regulator [Paenibacillus sp. NFR01]|uniref:helix-turn-helix transcriptional regulator n=1 Tax=Paenibacillus sp. NFR01 TaxID=1566279 RepID=UPI0008B7C25C|nr:helix-turn-helix domain-containing protein [Paenibacillus sp. NFR01]SEU27589.1 AraC family transcriptional regulator, cel operon repressor [Paenibacillus sp. NFR01]